MTELHINFKFRMIIPDEGIKINNLLYQLRKFMTQLYFEILKAIFSAIEEKAIARMKKTSPGQYVRNGHQKNHRQIRTAYGLFRYQMARVLDKKAHRTLTPLSDAMGLPRYRRHVNEAGEGGVGLVCHLSYRKSVKEVDRLLGTGMSKSTLHRQVQDFAEDKCDWPDLKKVPYRFLMADGTGVRLQEKGDDGKHNKKGSMRWVLASLGEKEKFELVGMWIDESWEKIRRDLNQRLDYSKLEVLFSDGESGIEENLLAPGMRPQRCLWHGKRQFPFLLYRDQLNKAQQKEFKDKLKSIPAMNLTQARLEKLTPEDLPKVKELAEKTKQGFQELVDALPEDKYPAGRIYVENLAKGVTTFFDFWFDNKVWIPLNTNAIENAFSQVKNRIWAVGKRWSKKGLLNWLKVVLNKVFFPLNWDQLWAEYLHLNLNLQLNLMEVKYQWI